jgi:hypothetical protein
LSKSLESGSGTPQTEKQGRVSSSWSRMVGKGKQKDRKLEVTPSEASMSTAGETEGEEE